MDVRTFIEEMERLAPPELAEDFDAGKIGLIVEGAAEFSTVCCALDATPAVVTEAIRQKAGMLVVHHTPLWTPLTAVTGSTASLMRDVLSAEHEHLGHAHQLRPCRRRRERCAGRTPLAQGHVPAHARPCRHLHSLLDEISRRLGCPLRIWGKLPAIKRLAIVAGSGFDPAFLAEAKARGADAFLSAEMKHSVARSSPLPCIEATHYALEAPAMKRLAARRGWHYIDDPPLLRTIP